MEIATAKAAAQIAAQIDALQALIADIEIAIAETAAAIAAQADAKANPPVPNEDGSTPAVSEGWLISSLVLVAPQVGSAKPGGTSLNLLVLGGKATAANSLLSMKQAKTTYDAALVALTTQLAGL